MGGIRQEQTRSPKVAEGLRLIAEGRTLQAASRTAGLTPQTLQMAWFRFVVRPEWEELKRLQKEGRIQGLTERQLHAEIDRLKAIVADLDGECQRLGAELADRDIERELDATDPEDWD